MLINNIPSHIRTLVSKYASTIQLGAELSLSWHAIEQEARHFSTDTELIDFQRRKLFRMMCEESAKHVTKDNLDSQVERDLNGLKLRTRMVAMNLPLFESLLAEAFTAGRLHERGDNIAS